VVVSSSTSTSTLTTNGSNIDVTGYAGNTTAAGSSFTYNCGVVVGGYSSSTTSQGGVISAGGSGNVSITGFGGTCARPTSWTQTGNSGVMLFG